MCPSEMQRSTICLSFFIEGKSALGLRGDGRDFQAQSPKEQSRAFIVIDVENQRVIDKGFSETCNASGSTCHDPSVLSQIGASFGQNGNIDVSVLGHNSMTIVPGFSGSIRFSPDGRGGYRAQGFRYAISVNRGVLLRRSRRNTEINPAAWSTSSSAWRFAVSVLFAQRGSEESMSNEDRSVVLHNLVRLLLIVLPTASGLFVLREALQEGLSYDAVGLAALVYLTAFLPVMLGGLLHSAVLVALNRRTRVTRLVAALTSPVAFGVILAMIDRSYLLLQWMPIGIALALYVFLIRLPDSDADGLRAAADRV